MKRFLLLPLLIILNILLFGQVVVENYTTLNTGSNGLLESHITSFAYGSDGKVWIATNDGFSFYDGNTWDYMDYEDFYPGLDKFIRLFTDSDSNIWINRFFNQGANLLLKYNGDSIISYGPAHGYYGQAMESNLYEDSEGYIYLQNPSSLLEFKNDTFQYISIPSGVLTGENLIRDVWGKLIISANNKTYREGPEGWYEMHHYGFKHIVSTFDSITWTGLGGYFASFYKDSLIEEFLPSNLQSTNIVPAWYSYSNAIVDNQGNIWSHPRYKKGLLKYNGQDFTYYTSDSAGFFSNMFYDELLLDDGRLWFSSWVGGIEEWDGNQFNHINTFDGLAQNKVNSILVKPDTIYFGTQNGCSILKDSIWQTVLYGNDENAGNGTQINDISDLGYNRFIFASGNYGLLQTTVLFDTAYSKSLQHNKYLRSYVSFARKIQEGFNNDFWFAHNDGFAHYFGDSTQWQWGVITYWENFTVADGLPNDTVYDLCKDSIGNIWLATGNGIASFQNNTFTVYNTAHGLIENQTRSIYFDSNENIWVGTIAGLSKYDGNSWLNYTHQNGLAGNLVNSIFEDSQGNMWFGTDQGLSKFSNQNFINYTTADGLSNNHINCITQDQDENIWVGTNFGASKLSFPQQIEEYNKSGHEFSIFPNPAFDKIKMNSTEKIINIELYSPSGQLLQKTTINKKQETIDISGLSPGNYFIRAIGNCDVWVKKIVVLR
ncbi:MAG: two-component regulator propeller domain-containing protein [Bacteroidota bacterium]|nr:two-component regulator propeller domain-containing protein [Bacteroidota bacterium]